MTTQSVITHHAGGSTSLVGRDSVELYRVIALRSSVKLHAKCGMIPTRGVTITKMFAMAGEYTGQKYKRGEHDRCVADLTVWIETMKSSIPVVDQRATS